MEGLTLDALVGQFGTAGVFIAFMIWDKLRTEKANLARTDADKALAVSLAALVTVVESVRAVIERIER